MDDRIAGAVLAFSVFKIRIEYSQLPCTIVFALAHLGPPSIIYIRRIKHLIQIMQKSIAQSVCGRDSSDVASDPDPWLSGFLTEVKNW